VKDDGIHRFTPSVTAQDSRALTVRNVSYLRAVAGAEAEALITRQRHNAAGRQTEQWDPRLSDAGTTPNLVTVHTLSGAPLSVDSVDAGWRLSLPGMAGQSLERWDARGNHWLTTYDQQLRVLNDATADQSSVETFTYADASADSGHNLRGQMTVLNDTSGALKRQSFSLLGEALEQSRSFESAEAYCSRQSLSPLNEVLTQTDAGGHCQLFRHDIAGQIKQVALLRQGASAAQVILQTAHYNAAGQIVERVAGNQLVSHWRYDSANDSLLNAQAGVTGQPFVQDFAYAYDAVGNVEHIDDHTFTPVYFANRLIDGQRAFRYDSLYRLTSASGHDAACATDLPGHPSPSDPNDLHNYTQHFEYDRANNLIKFVHGRAINGFTRQMQIAPSSNRALRWQDDDPPPDFAAAFDAHGNQRRLGHGPQLVWNAIDQLQRITLLEHSNGLPDDQEIYLYSQGERVSKRHETHSPASAHFQQVRYLPGLEIRTRDNGEELHVITLPDNVRCLHWRSPPPTDIENNQLRYSLGDHLGSSAVELDQQGQVLSRETYYPFGGTATWLAHSKSAGDYKTIRYSGKEMDVSGLYYYGARYYAPWLQRWVSADPAGDVDGLNVYVMVGNNPLTNIDPDGRALTKSPGWIAIAAGFKSETNRFVEEFDDVEDAMTPEQREQTTFKEFLGKKSGIGALTRGGVLGCSLGTSIGIAVGGAVPIENMSAYTGPAFGFLGTYAGGHAYAYLRYRFFKSNVARAAAQYKHKVDTAKKLAEDMLQGVVPTDIQNQMANMRIQTAYDMLAEVRTWPVTERALFTSGTVEGETITDITERYENIKKTMIGGTADVVDPLDNQSLGGRSSITSLNDFASAAGDSVQGESIQGENAQPVYSWKAQFMGFFKIGTRQNSIPMDSLA
jgi:insecticidal toxin complex protein TccC